MEENFLSDAVLQTGRTMVPVRFVSEALGVKVDWDGTTQTVTIITVKLR